MGIRNDYEVDEQRHKYEVLGARTLTVQEFKEIYKIKSIARARKLVNQEDFPKVKVGSSYLIITSKIENWLIKNIGKAY